MAEIRDAAETGLGRAGFAALAPPATMRAAYVLRDDVDLFDADLPPHARDPRTSLKVSQVPVPQVGPNQALVAVMASAVNYNSIWAATFDPVPSFSMVDAYACESDQHGKHLLDHHILGSDGCGVVLAVGPTDAQVHAGDEVTVHPQVTDAAHPDYGHVWGYETNFGGFAELALVNVNQLLPKPAHLSWEEAASLPLVSETCYSMLVGDRGARLKLGEVVLIWGAAGGTGSLAVQYVLAAGGVPVCIVSSERKAALLRAAGAEAVIDRTATNLSFVRDDGTPDERAAWQLRRRVRSMVGRDPDIVFEHLGQTTFATSVFVAGRYGRVVTCGSTTGYVHTYDNRHLWMAQKRIIGITGCTPADARAASRLAEMGKVHPTLSRTFDLDHTADALRYVQTNQHVGKVGVLCLAQRRGGGVRDPAMRSRYIEQIQRYAEDAREG